jgi:hypothetical protein
VNRDLKQIRSVIDGSDSFLSGYQIAAPRANARVTPLWVYDKAVIKRILLRSFPRFDTDVKQRDAAGRWARIIHLYFNLRYTYKEVAEELDENPSKIRHSIDGIQRASKGLKANRSGASSGRRSGRPKGSKNRCGTRRVL